VEVQLDSENTIGVRCSWLQLDVALAFGGGGGVGGGVGGSSDTAGAGGPWLWSCRMGIGARNFVSPDLCLLVPFHLLVALGTPDCCVATEPQKIVTKSVADS